jgi:hypothetical protein
MRRCGGHTETQITRVMLLHNDCRGDTATPSFAIISNNNHESRLVSCTSRRKAHA